MTWQECVEYCEYLSRAVSLKLTQSKDRSAEQIWLLSLSFMQSTIEMKYIFIYSKSNNLFNLGDVKVNKRVQSETTLKQICLQEFLDSVSVP
jgi:hypothetical protein